MVYLYFRSVGRLVPAIMIDLGHYYHNKKHHSMTKIYKTLGFILIALFFISLNNSAQGDECCSRHAIYSACTYNDPMGIIGSHDSYCRSIRGRLAELMTQDCFHFMRPEVPEHEYSFDTDFVSGLDEYTDEGRPIRSRLTVTMYFEGEQREFVHRWQTQGTWDIPSNSGTTWSGHGNKLRNRYKEGPYIIEIMERFEKKPVDCQVTPDKEELNAGEVIDIELTNFRDVFGESSREFNRIIVHAYAGEIMNGEECNIGPDYKVFRVNDGAITVKYKAPYDCEEPEDRITVYSSCDILPLNRIPMNETQIYERLVEKTIDIKCYDATITIRKTYDKTLNSSHEEDRFDGPCKTHWENEHTLNESIEAVVTLSLKLEEVQDMPIYNQTFEYYKPVSVSLSTFNYNSNEHKFNAYDHSGAGCVQSWHRINIDYFRNVETYEIEVKQYTTQTYWIVVFDNETGKAVKIIPSVYDIAYEIHEQEKLHFIGYSDQGREEYTETTNKNISKSFELGPVGEKIADPTIKKSDTWIQDYLKRQGFDLPPGVEIPTPSNIETILEIFPDILVKSGDGKTSFGGYGNRTIRADILHGYTEKKLHYTWQMTRRKK